MRLRTADGVFRAERGFSIGALASVPQVKAAAMAAENGSETAAVEPTVGSAMQWSAIGIEVAGVAIIVVGAAAATIAFLKGGLVATGWSAAFPAVGPTWDARCWLAWSFSWRLTSSAPSQPRPRFELWPR